MLKIKSVQGEELFPTELWFTTSSTPTYPHSLVETSMNKLGLSQSRQTGRQITATHLC